jgi:hypothetical protein
MFQLEAVLTNLSSSVGAWVGIACMTFCETIDLFCDYLVLAIFVIFFKHKITLRDNSSRSS